MLSTNWKTFIAARLDNTAGNKNTSVFTEAWSPEQSQDQRFQTLTADPDMVLFTADSNKKLLVLHSFKNAGGTLFHPEKKLMWFWGCWGDKIAQGVQGTVIILHAFAWTGLVLSTLSCHFSTPVESLCLMMMSRWSLWNSLGSISKFPAREAPKSWPNYKSCAMKPKPPVISHKSSGKWRQGAFAHTKPATCKSSGSDITGSTKYQTQNTGAN